MKQGFLPWVLALTVLGLAGCETAKQKPVEAAPALVQIGERALTVAAVQAEVDRLPLERRVEVTTVPEQEAFIQKTIDQEILAVEATRLGYDRAPEVLAAAKRAMVAKLLKERIGNGPGVGEITDANIRRYYDEHQTEFGPPERIRIALIVVKDATKARGVHTEAETAVAEARKQGSAAAFDAFRALVEKHTEEEGARDVTISIGLNGSPYPRAVTDAGLALKEAGRVSPVLETPSGFFIVQLKEHTPASTLPFEQVKGRVARSLSEQLRDRKTVSLVSLLAKQQGAVVHREHFGKVQFRSDPLIQAAAENPPQSELRP